MRSVYCCNSASYEKYYLDQVGHVRYFSGTTFQRGYVLGNIFASLEKAILLLVKSWARAIRKQALKSGVAFAFDVLVGKNVKQAAVQRTKQAGSTLLRQATASKKQKASRIQKKKRKKYNNIFTCMSARVQIFLY